jgi:hypothetical protein
VYHTYTEEQMLDWTDESFQIVVLHDQHSKAAPMLHALFSSAVNSQNLKDWQAYLG